MRTVEARSTIRGPVEGHTVTDLNAADKHALVGVDVPSGLDCNTGESSHTTVRADMTITFVAVKKGFLEPSAAPWVGRIRVADIGVPRELIREVASTDA